MSAKTQRKLKKNRKLYPDINSGVIITPLFLYLLLKSGMLQFNQSDDFKNLKTKIAKVVSLWQLTKQKI